MIYRYLLDIIDDSYVNKGLALDLGCGPGAASTILASFGFDVEAVDTKEYDICSPDEAGSITFTKSDIRDFKIQKGKYDFIHARNVLHFLNKNEIRTLVKSMYQGLKKNGILYFTLSGDKDGWKDKSKNVTFLTERELSKYVESEIKASGPIHNKIVRLGYGTTTTGVRKYTHTISYTVIKKKA
jgi:2-polyprenyl-3-methyl-5-hydroxy-6-metoxy-1,4-benzoquinol methylase